MARVASKSSTGGRQIPTNAEWLESVGLQWDRMTPRQVRFYLMESDGLSAAEADAYIEGLRDTEAGSLMLWGREVG